MEDQISNRANLSLGLGIVALACWAAGVAISGENGDENGWVWVLMALFGAGALAAGVTAGNGKPRGKALIGAVIGGLGVAVFLAFVIADALG